VIDSTPPQLARRTPLPPQLTRRAGAIGVLAFALFGIITFRLWYLQVLTAPQNTALATLNEQRTIPLPAPRGEILDAGGAVLADTQVGAQASITADYLPPAKTSARWQVYVRLSRLLHIPAKQIWQVIEGQQWPGYQPAPIMDNLTPYQLTYLEIHASWFPGVTVQVVNQRQYPLGPIAASVLGQIGPITQTEVGGAAYKGIAAGTYVGQAGLEAEYNRYLQGRPGAERVQVDAAGYPTGKAKVTPAVAGESLQTSLHLGLEREGYIALNEAIAKAPHDSVKQGAFFAMNPYTGRVLALGSVPSYDPSMFVTPPSYAQYDRLQSEYAFDNLATDGLFPTGSTFKPITALAGLQSGKITAQTLQGTGACIPISTKTFCNSGHNDYGDVDLVTALQESVDTYFYILGAKLNCATCDDAAIQTEARALGLGERPRIDLPGGGQPGVVPDYGWTQSQNRVYDAQFCNGSRPKRRYASYQLAIIGCAQTFFLWTVGQNVGLATGQGYLLASPMQMAVAYSTIFNNGTVWEPQLAESIRSPTGTLVQQLPPPAIRRHVDIDPYYRQLVMEGLHLAAQGPSGTSTATFGSFPMTVYGKTGTAVHVGQPDQSWYVCFVPDGAKSIVIAVTIPQAGFGAQAAAPAARLMLSQWFGLPKKWVAGTSTDL